LETGHRYQAEAAAQSRGFKGKAKAPALTASNAASAAG
jgi:hypothetical protein